MSMPCHKPDTLVHAYVDGELAGDDREAYERHLGECEVCAQASRLQARFKAALRGHMPRPSLPLGLRTRIEAALTELPAPRRRFPWQSHPRLFTVSAAACVTLLLLVTNSGRGSRPLVLEQAISTFQRDLPLDVLSQSCSTISDWFRGRLDFNVPSKVVPAGANCQGGRVINVGNQFGAYVVYHVPAGHRMSVFVFPSDPQTDDSTIGSRQRVLGGRPMYLDSHRGVSTAMYRQQGGLDYVFTADVDEDRLAQMVETAFLSAR